MSRIPPPEKVAPQLLAAFRAVRKGERRAEYPSRVELRASSLPICPRAYHMYRRLAPKKRPREQETFMRDSSTLMGTALHIALQKWFGIAVADHAYGNWGCKPCNKIRRHKLGVQTCKICGNEMEYVEYEVRKNQHLPVSGHLDLILRYIEMDVALDFKGGYPKKLLYLREHGVEKKHYYQLNAYANAVRLGKPAGQDFGPLTNINKLVIVYVDRGQPWFNWYPVQFPVSEAIFSETLDLIARAKESLRQLRIPRGFCLNAADNEARFCEWRQLCFSPLLETMLEDKVYPEDDRPQDRRLDDSLADPQKQRAEEGKDTHVEETKWHLSGDGDPWG